MIHGLEPVAASLIGEELRAWPFVSDAEFAAITRRACERSGMIRMWDEWTRTALDKVLEGVPQVTRADYDFVQSVMKNKTKSEKPGGPHGLGAATCAPTVPVHPAQKYLDRIQHLEERFNFSIDGERFEEAGHLREEIKRLYGLADAENQKEEKRIQAEKDRERERMTSCSEAPRKEAPRLNFDTGTLAFVVMAEDERGYKRLLIHEARLHAAGEPPGFSYGAGSFALYGVEVPTLRNLRVDS